MAILTVFSTESYKFLQISTNLLFSNHLKIKNLTNLHKISAIVDPKKKKINFSEMKINFSENIFFQKSVIMGKFYVSM